MQNCPFAIDFLIFSVHTAVCVKLYSCTKVLTSFLVYQNQLLNYWHTIRVQFCILGSCLACDQNSWLSWESLCNVLEGEANRCSFPSCTIISDSFWPPVYQYMRLFQTCSNISSVIPLMTPFASMCKQGVHALWSTTSFWHKNEMHSGFPTVRDEAFQEWVQQSSTVQGVIWCSFTRTEVCTYNIWSLSVHK